VGFEHKFSNNACQIKFFPYQNTPKLMLAGALPSDPTGRAYSAPQTPSWDQGGRFVEGGDGEGED